MSAVVVNEIADVRSVLDSCMASGGLLLDETQFGPAFFDLASGVAGELFQKVANYRAKLAIVIADPAKYGSRFSELAYEHRSHDSVRFFKGAQDARRWLAYNPIVKC